MQAAQVRPRHNLALERFFFQFEFSIAYRFQTERDRKHQGAGLKEILLEMFLDLLEAGALSDAQQDDQVRDCQAAEAVGHERLIEELTNSVQQEHHASSYPAACAIEPKATPKSTAIGCSRVERSHSTAVL